jgi:hypothetical protein
MGKMAICTGKWRFLFYGGIEMFAVATMAQRMQVKYVQGFACFWASIFKVN